MTLRVSAVTAILTDIEGTTSPISFVKETLFPYARARLASFLAAHAHEPDVARAIASAATLGGVKESDLDSVIGLLTGWMDQDAKIQPLKELQGMIWSDGYKTGDLRGAIFDDAAARLQTWKDEGLRLAVYSSGSVLAQKLLFSSTARGDLTPLFSAFFDTAVGPKRAPESYRRIAEALRIPAREILFLSDIAEELDAAASAGMQTAQLARASEGTLTTSRHAVAAVFTEIEIGGLRAAQEMQA